MNTKQKIFYGVWVFAIIASAQAATTSSGITNKASRFSDVLSEMGAATTDSSNSELAETIRRQRALLDAAATSSNTAGGTSSNITTANACDSGLRKCMAEKCGTDFTKCAKDSTTVWGNKMDACRRNTKCTGHEYTLLAPEILADRNAAIELSYYNSVVNCGNKYNDCMFTACGKTLEKCLSKSAGDSAMAKCKSIADECREQDSGLAGRISGVFGDLRTVAAAGAQKDEKRLYELRDLMRTQCTRFGAMFDERTLDCVYTVNFFAGEDHTLMASKKLYSGDTFQCTPDWFGVDITTYMENAQRLTRSQKGASAAAMGAGLGTAAGLWTSGAVTRAIDTQKAEKQAKEACENDGGEWVSAGFNKGKTCDMSNAEQNCTDRGDRWDGEKCVKENNGTLTETSLNGGGRNPGAIEQVTLSNVCKQYTKEQCDNAKGCTYQNNQCVASKEIQKGNIICQARTKIDCEDDGECKFSNGLCISVLDTIDIDTSQTVANIICNKKSKNDCTGNCVWDATTNNGKGKCVAKTDSSTGGGSNQGNSSEQTEETDKEDKSVDCSKYTKEATCRALRARKCWWNGLSCVDASEKENTVDITDLSIQDDRTGKIPLFATLECNGKESKTSTTVTLTKIPKDATCKIRAAGCITKTNIGAQQLVGQNSLQLHCNLIDDCIDSGGTWQRNKNNNDGQCTLTAQDCAKKNMAYNKDTNSCYECKITERVLNGECVIKTTSETLPGIMLPNEKPKIKLATTLKDLDTSIDGDDSCYYDFQSQDSPKTCDNLITTPGQWAVKFSEYTIKGIATCNNSKTTPKQANNTKGVYCYCQITSPANSQWVYLDIYQGGNCPKICTSNCAHAIKYNIKNYRQKIYGHQ